MEGITREMFDAGRDRRFGTANPDVMRVPFWEWMIRGEDQPGKPEEGLLGRHGMMMRHGVLKSGYGPWRVRDKFGVPVNRDDGPIWTFDRMGRTETELPDGRVICVGGEHEDFYDPDFCIYNDVVVFERHGEFQIYGYPEGVFPPTDFHTATLVGDQILIIGGLRYVRDRVPGTCTVFTLDTSTFRIERLDTTGEGPGWIHHHKAELMEDGIHIRGGSRISEQDGSKRGRKNLDVFRFDSTACRWERIEHLSGWRTFSIARRDALDFFRGDSEGFDPAWLTGLQTTFAMKHGGDSTRRVFVDDVAVNLQREAYGCRVRVEGILTQARLTEFLADLVRQIERQVGVPCEVEET